jgi:DNA repair protein RadC
MDETNGARELHTLIRDLPASERPRERLRDAGADALSAAELLAILLRTGSSKESALAQAQRLLKDLGGLDGILKAPFGELRQQHGLGEAKAAQIKAALELGVRAAAAAHAERRMIRSPEDVADLMLAEMALFEQEHVRVLQLDVRARLIAVADVYQGSVHTVQVRFGELFRDAVRVNASAVVVVHNHPSGDPTPSAADIAMTKGLVEAGKLLDIEVNDHVILGGQNYVSMRALGLGFPRNGA